MFLGKLYTDKYSLIYPDGYSAPFYSVYPYSGGGGGVGVGGRPVTYRIPPLYQPHQHLLHHQDRRRWDRKF